jgi:cell division protein FtsZ
MIELPRNAPNRPPAEPPRVLVLGVGNAGVALADRLILAGCTDSATIATVNTDSTSLDASIAETRLLIGSRTARGLGAGGDPDLGHDAATESLAEIKTLLADAEIILLCAGLGGGVGSGALPLIAETAKQHGARVLAICTRPFTFEGKRRTQQAAAAIESLAPHADAIFSFDNDRMADLAEPLSGVHETFSASDDLVAANVAAILRLTRSQGPINVSLGDLIALFQGPADSCAFGSGSASGRNRANEAIELALKNPMLARGNLLAQARTALIRIEGPADLRFVEVQTMMQSLTRHLADDCALNFAVDIADSDSAPITVSILTSLGEQPAKRPAADPPTVEPKPVRVPIETVEIPEPLPAPTGEFIPPDPSELFDTDPFTIPKVGASKKPAKPKQEILSLDAASRGRFDKSEPTIVGGEDLDVPTFIRQKIRLS